MKPNEEKKRQKQVALILEKLISLTIEEVQMYPSIQAKIWGSIGQVPELIDMVLDNFIHRSVNSGLNSPMVEIMADTAVALASANVQLVAKKVIGRLCRVMIPLDYLISRIYRLRCYRLWIRHAILQHHC